MEIIKRGKWQPPTFTAKIECYYCHSILKIDADDVRWCSDDYEYGGYEVGCPVCGHSISLDWKTKRAYNRYLNSK